MTTSDYETVKRGGAGLYVPIVLILFVGGALSIAAYAYEPGLTIAQSLVAGFGGLAGIIIGLIGALFGVVIALVGAVFGLAVGGGAVALTLFIIASPVIAIILLVMMMRRSKACPNPALHE